MKLEVLDLCEKFGKEMAEEYYKDARKHGMNNYRPWKDALPDTLLERLPEEFAGLIASDEWDRLWGVRIPVRQALFEQKFTGGMHRYILYEDGKQVSALHIQGSGTRMPFGYVVIQSVDELFKPTDEPAEGELKAK